MTIAVFIDTVSRAGPAVMLAVFVWGGLQGWWVYGRYHSEVVSERDKQYQKLLDEQSRQYAELLTRFEALQKDRDKWIEIAMQSAHLATRAVGVVESQGAVQRGQ